MVGAAEQLDCPENARQGGGEGRRHRQWQAGRRVEENAQATHRARKKPRGWGRMPRGFVSSASA
jgi:hypothetical protein